jgi:enolase
MAHTSISKIRAREILDSRGNPTMKSMRLRRRSGASRRSGRSEHGEHEAWELRDGDTSRFGGKGVRTAVANVNNRIAPVLKG